MQGHRRRLLGWLAIGATGSALGALAPIASAQPRAFPGRPVRVVYPFSPGGMGDSMVRALFAVVGQGWGQPVVVENRPGAGGMIGAAEVAKAEPDGHTLLFTFTALVQVPHLVRKAPFDPVRDFAPVSELATTHIVLVVHPDLPARTLKDFVESAARESAPHPYGTYGVGTTGHLLMESLARQAGIKLAAIPYKGEGPLTTDLLGGQITVGFMSATSAAQHVRAGKLRALAVAGGASRSPLLPDVPSLSEAGYPQLDGGGWIGLFAPARTPAPLIDQIAEDVNRALTQPDLRRRFGDMGLIPRGTTPATFADAVRFQHDYWGKAIRAADIRID